jgi:hypothetical protein
LGLRELVVNGQMYGAQNALIFQLTHLGNNYVGLAHDGTPFASADNMHQALMMCHTEGKGLHGNGAKIGAALAVSPIAKTQMLVFSRCLNETSVVYEFTISGSNSIRKNVSENYLPLFQTLTENWESKFRVITLYRVNSGKPLSYNMLALFTTLANGSISKLNVKYSRHPNSYPATIRSLHSMFSPQQHSTHVPIHPLADYFHMFATHNYEFPLSSLEYENTDNGALIKFDGKVVIHQFAGYRSRQTSVVCLRDLSSFRGNHKLYSLVADTIFPKYRGTLLIPHLFNTHGSKRLQSDPCFTTPDLASIFFSTGIVTEVQGWSKLKSTNPVDREIIEYGNSKNNKAEIVKSPFVFAEFKVCEIKSLSYKINTKNWEPSVDLNNGELFNHLGTISDVFYASNSKVSRGIMKTMAEAMPTQHPEKFKQFFSDNQELFKDFCNPSDFITVPEDVIVQKNSKKVVCIDAKTNQEIRGNIKLNKIYKVKLKQGDQFLENTSSLSEGVDIHSSTWSENVFTLSAIEKSKKVGNAFIPITDEEYCHKENYFPKRTVYLTGYNGKRAELKNKLDVPERYSTGPRKIGKAEDVDNATTHVKIDGWHMPIDLYSMIANRGEF